MIVHTLGMVGWLLHKQIFVYLDEDFAINWIFSKFRSLLFIGKNCIGVTERGNLKKYL